MYRIVVIASMLFASQAWAGITSKTVEYSHGSTVLEGAVQIVIAGRVLKTARAIIEKDGTIRMDSALVSRTADSH